MIYKTMIKTRSTNIRPTKGFPELFLNWVSLKYNKILKVVIREKVDI